jgi:hypothetical protein
MLMRFGAVGTVALLLIPLFDLPAAATLFSMVAVLFATTVMEPVFFRSDLSTASPGDVVTLATKR